MLSALTGGDATSIALIVAVVQTTSRGLVAFAVLCPLCFALRLGLRLHRQRYNELDVADEVDVERDAVVRMNASRREAKEARTQKAKMKAKKKERAERRASRS